MKILSTFFVFLFAGTLKAQKACPVNFDSDSLVIALTAPKQWHEKMIAFDALVSDVKEDIGGHAYVKVKLTGGAIFWYKSCRQFNSVHKNDMVRILGYFEQLGEADSSLIRYNSTGIGAIALAEIDRATKQMAMIPGCQGQVNEWVNGKIPEGEKED